MTLDEKLEIEHRLTKLEDKASSNTIRLHEHDVILKENSDLIGAIKELANETKHMREDINRITSRVDRLERKDGDTWAKFKWHIITSLVSIILTYLAVSIGLG